MTGTHSIVIQNKKIKYSFTIRRNITIIRGDSATGKTVLVEMIREYDENGADSGITFQCDKRCTVLSGGNWQAQLAIIQDSIVFIDEGARFVSSKEFAAAIQKTDNYYVIVTREGLAMLPYSIHEIYGIRDAGKYGQLKQTYNELFPIYTGQETAQISNPRVVITEDANAGFQFFSHLCQNHGRRCLSAYGKSNIFQTILEQTDGSVLVIADGAAFGSEMEKTMKLVKAKGNVTLYLPESFEWLILNAGLISDPQVDEILSDPSQWIDSCEYVSWERFFTALLVRITASTYLQYSKRMLNPAYLQETAVRKITDGMKPISL